MKSNDWILIREAAREAVSSNGKKRESAIALVGRLVRRQGYRFSAQEYYDQLGFPKLALNVGLNQSIPYVLDRESAIADLAEEKYLATGSLHKL